MIKNYFLLFFSVIFVLSKSSYDMCVFLVMKITKCLPLPHMRLYLHIKQHMVCTIKSHLLPPWQGHIRLERLPCKRKFGCSNPSCDRPMSLTQEVAFPHIVFLGKHNNFSYFTLNQQTMLKSNFLPRSGTSGWSCSIKCPQNYYGQLCRHKCSCNEDQYCNHVYGCSGII